MTLEHEESFVAKSFKALASLHEQKGREYGEASLVAGAILKTLFENNRVKPDMNSIDDMQKLAMLSIVVMKLCRYVNNFHDGHTDSLDDICVYIAMMKEIDVSHCRNF